MRRKSDGSSTQIRPYSVGDDDDAVASSCLSPRGQMFFMCIKDPSKYVVKPLRRAH